MTEGQLLYDVQLALSQMRDEVVALDSIDDGLEPARMLVRALARSNLVIAPPCDHEDAPITVTSPEELSAAAIYELLDPPFPVRH